MIYIFSKNAGLYKAILLLLFASGGLIGAEDPMNVFKGINLGFASLDIGGGLRLRGQLQNNFNAKKYAEGRDGFGEERLRIECNLKFIETMHLFIQLQDAHVWDLQYSTKDFYPPYSPYTNPLDVRQAFFEYQNIANTPIGIKFGRQTFLYGDNRILGPGEWCNAGRYFWDAAKLLYSSNYLKTDLFVAKQVISNPYGFDNEAADLTVYGLYSALKVFNPNTDFFYVLKENDNNRFTCSTIGTRFDGNFSMFFYSGTFAYQFGDTGMKKIRAYGYNAKLGYLAPKLLMSEIGAEYSYASGDGNPADGTHKTFDGVLGAIDLFYGRMALFAWMNLKDYQINFDIKPTRKISATLQYHWFDLAENKDAWYYGNGKPQRKDITGTSGSSLGNGFVSAVKYDFNKHCNMYAGFYYFIPDEFIKNTPGYQDESSLTFCLTEYKF